MNFAADAILRMHKKLPTYSRKNTKVILAFGNAVFGSGGTHSKFVEVLKRRARGRGIPCVYFDEHLTSQMPPNYFFQDPPADGRFQRTIFPGKSLRRKYSFAFRRYHFIMQY